MSAQLSLDFERPTPTLDAARMASALLLQKNGIELDTGLCRYLGAISFRVEWERNIQSYPKPWPSGPGACWGIYCNRKPRLALTASVQDEYRDTSRLTKRTAGIAA